MSHAIIMIILTNFDALSLETYASETAKVFCIEVLCIILGSFFCVLKKYSTLIVTYNTFKNC